MTFVHHVTLFFIMSLVSYSYSPGRNNIRTKKSTSTVLPEKLEACDLGSDQDESDVEHTLDTSTKGRNALRQEALSSKH